jgi:hypothetical protein
MCVFCERAEVCHKEEGGLEAQGTRERRNEVLIALLFQTVVFREVHEKLFYNLRETVDRLSLFLPSKGVLFSEQRKSIVEIKVKENAEEEFRKIKC